MLIRIKLENPNLVFSENEYAEGTRIYIGTKYEISDSENTVVYGG